MTKIGHRSAEDELWQETKEKVKIRDNGQCRCCMIMTPQEIGIRESQHLPSYLFTPCDAAHYMPVGRSIEKTYDIDNVFYFCRACHDALDSYRSPVTGQPISAEEHEAWWSRIRKINMQNANNNIASNGVTSYLDTSLPKKRFDPEAWLDS